MIRVKGITSPPDDKIPDWNYLIVGAVASVAVLFVFTPTDGVKLLAQSIAAGYVGQAILDALGERVKAALAKKEAEEKKEQGKQAVKNGQEVIKMFKNYVDEHEKAIIKGKPEELTRELLRTSLPKDTQEKLAILQHELERLDSDFNM